MNNKLEKLVRKYKEGRSEVFDEIYHLTFREVYLCIFCIVNNKTEAEDLLQDTYVRVFQNLEKYTSSDNFCGWLKTIGKNLAKNYVMRKREQPFDFATNEQLIGSKRMREDEVGVILKMKSILDEESFEIIMMCDVVGYTLSEVAKKLDKPLSTIAYKRKSGLKKVKESLVRIRSI